MEVYRGYVCEDTFILDPFIKEEYWINRRWAYRYFEEEYGLTPQQVWNLINHKELNYQPKCPVCGEPLDFINLSKGYKQYCSLSHKMTYQMENNEDFYDAAMSSCNSKDPHYGWNSVESAAKSAYTKFINAGDPNDICDFYIALIDDIPGYNFKFGVTDSIDSRSNFFGFQYSSIHSLFKKSRLGIAAFERDLKYYLDQNHEYFESSKFPIIKKWIRDNINKDIYN